MDQSKVQPYLCAVNKKIIKKMATKLQIAKMLEENLTGSKRQFIEINFGSFDFFVDCFSTEAANSKMDLITSYEEVYALCAYFSQEQFDSQK